MGKMKEDFQALFTSLQLVKDIVSREDLAQMFGKAPKTIRRWAQRHNFHHVDGPARKKAYYNIDVSKGQGRDTAHILDL